MTAWELEFYGRIRDEIVRQAVRDLQNAIKKSKRIGCVCGEQTKLEKWFLSPWGQILCGDNGEYIIEKCHQTYNSSNYANGKRQLPEELQRRVFEEWQRKTRYAEIINKYGITKSQFYKILGRWSR